MTNTETMIKALRVLSEDIQSGDGVANACVADAANMIENMSTQLAKANEDYKTLFSAFESCQDELKESNERESVLSCQLDSHMERVAELEQANLELAANVEACCELTDMDMGAAIERLFEIDNTESKALLNKFAIEKKQEAILTIKDKWIKKASEMPPQLECRSKGSSCYNWAMFYARELTDEAEQLRKEQE